MHWNPTSQQPYMASDPILVQIAMDTGEIKAHVKDLNRRVEHLEKSPRCTLQDILPWLYGLLVVALALAGRIKWDVALNLLH